MMLGGFSKNILYNIKEYVYPTQFEQREHVAEAWRSEMVSLLAVLTLIRTVGFPWQCDGM